MKKRLSLFLLFLNLLPLGGVRAQSARPNILFIFADDLRADALGCYGNPYVSTPTLDSLARQGTSFANAYILGGDQGAVCAPSRAMLLSGQSFFRVSDKLNGVLTLPMHLRQHGYTTFLTGKWHNEREAVAAGFDRAQNVMLGGMANHFEVPVRDLKPDGTFTEPEKKGFSTDIFTNTALDFLDQHDGQKPFFAYVPYTVPHDPRSPLPEYLRQYDEQGVPLPPNFMPLHPFSFGNSMAIRDEQLAAFPRTPDVIRAQTAAYYALITHLDQSVNLLIRKLKQKGLDKNTLIIFTSDNGLGLGSHGLLGKQNVYEHSVRVPLILAGPGIPKNKTTDAFAYLFDLFPTLCQYARLPVPGGLDGQGLWPVIQGKAKGVRTELMTAYMQFQRSVRDARYKLIRYPAIDHTLLFDLRQDPYELRNLAEKPEHAPRVQALLALLQTEQKKYGDTLPLTAEKVLPRHWDYRTIERKPDPWQPQELIERYFKD
ncbi:sulfatase-like hydrolase/transferase [Rhabdobacter roseus]|uniref:Arylsulfatase A-like enzyme n=1 Tax=Rhabdobacter roseus TaxID=1655419 RepID=A0A840TU60_9BACT|nr:sulfatase-like hydrolase/transferase [Rhabdobacter roseus]MBB5286445.1 arylsulfatase A-like enzyme [Rhabdobacter roseus]